MPVVYTTPRPTARTVHQGDLVGRPGQLLEHLEVLGMVRLNGATLRSSIVRGRNVPGFNGSLVASYPGDAAGAVVEDVQIDAAFPAVGQNGLAVGTGMSVRRTTITGTTDGLVVAGDDVLLEDVTVSDLRWWEDARPAHSDGSHSDAAQIEGGRNITLRRCNLRSVVEPRSRSCQGIMVTQNHARINGLTIDDCDLGGGHVTLNISPDQRGRGPMLGVAITNTRFRDDQTNGNVHMIIPRALYPSVVLRGNTVVTTGATPKVYQQP